MSDTRFPTDICVTESAGPRYETRYEYGTRFGWNDDRRSGIDLTFTRRGVEVSGFYDSMVGLRGGFIPWSEVDVIRAQLTERISRLGKVSGAAPKP